MVYPVNSQFYGFNNSPYLKQPNYINPNQPQNMYPKNNMIFNAPPRKQEDTASKKVANFLINTLAVGGAVTILGFIADCLLCKGSGAGKFSSKLKELAKLRVDNNVVKRTNLTMDTLRNDISNVIAKNGLKTGDKLFVIKANKLPDGTHLPSLALKDNALVLSNSDGKIFKILDSGNFDKDISKLFGSNDQIRVSI